MPGHSALTRTPYGARSLAAHCAKLITAAFAALYGGSVCEPIWPATDERNKIEREVLALSPVSKRAASAMNGANACAKFTAPIRLTFSTGSQSEGFSFQN